LKILKFSAFGHLLLIHSFPTILIGCMILLDEFCS